MKAFKDFKARTVFNKMIKEKLCADLTEKAAGASDTTENAEQ